MSSECSKYVIYSETQRKGKGGGLVLLARIHQCACLSEAPGSYTP